MSCEFCEACPFYNSVIESRAVELLTKVYCQGRPDGCARHMIATTLGHEHVPQALYPNQTHLVPSILRARCSGTGEPAVL